MLRSHRRRCSIACLLPVAAAASPLFRAGGAGGMLGLAATEMAGASPPLQSSVPRPVPRAFGGVCVVLA